MALINSCPLDNSVDELLISTLTTDAIFLKEAGLTLAEAAQTVGIDVLTDVCDATNVIEGYVGHCGTQQPM